MQELQVGISVTIRNRGVEEPLWMAGCTGVITRIDGEAYWVEFPVDKYGHGAMGSYHKDDLLAPS